MLSATMLLMRADAVPPIPPNMLPALTARARQVSVSPVRIIEASPPIAQAKQSALIEPAAPIPGADADQSDRQSDIVVTARPRTPSDDPLATINAGSFAATQAIDKALVGPAALTYEKVIPNPVRSGLRNLLSNLHEPVVVLNYLLQIKPGKAGETLGRFAINSVLGGAGLFDIAKRRPFRLPHRPNGFADTLGYYGVKPGPFLYLPLIGPTTIRDLVGGGIDRLLLPLSIGRPFNRLVFTVPVGVVSALDHRAEFDEQLHELHDGVADPYANSRAFYLRRRQAEIDGLHNASRSRRRAAESAPQLP